MKAINSKVQVSSLAPFLSRPDMALTGSCTHLSDSYQMLTSVHLLSVVCVSCVDGRAYVCIPEAKRGLSNVK